MAVSYKWWKNCRIFLLRYDWTSWCKYPITHPKCTTIYRWCYDCGKKEEVDLNG